MDFEVEPEILNWIRNQLAEKNGREVTPQQLLEEIDETLGILQIGLRLYGFKLSKQEVLDVIKTMGVV